MKYKQAPPFCVQVELTEGCNLYCDFCGLQGIRTKTDKTFKFMSISTAETLAEQMREHKWNSRIEFAMHGEPTLNPNYIKIISVFRYHLPKAQLMMTSNGGGLLRPPGVVKSLAELFDAGLNVFAFDAYEYVKIKDKIDAELWENDERRAWPDRLWELPFDVHRYPDEKDFSPHNRYPKGTRKFIRVQDISVAAKGTHSVLNNHCGNGSAPLKRSITARCAKPFRELAVRYNGNVAICCNDWRGIYKCGNVVSDGLLDVWHSPAMEAARKFLIKGARKELSPCDVCDAKSYRVGLLPDKFGKEKLAAPTPTTADVAHYAASGKPYAKAVRPAYLDKEV